jgi:hypothetical protein
MGYMLSTLANLPDIHGIDLYIFVVGVRAWDDDLASVVRRNFDRLSGEIGPKAAIVKGLGRTDLIPELYAAIGNNPLLGKLAYSGERDGGGILLLGVHPTKFSDGDLILYASLKLLEERFGGIHAFFDELCDFAATRDPKFLERFRESPSVADGVLDIVDLKPNLFGIGLNINAAIDKVRGLLRGRD